MVHPYPRAYLVTPAQHVIAAALHTMECGQELEDAVLAHCIRHTRARTVGVRVRGRSACARAFVTRGAYKDSPPGVHNTARTIFQVAHGQRPRKRRACFQEAHAARGWERYASPAGACDRALVRESDAVQQRARALLHSITLTHKRPVARTRRRGIPLPTACSMGFLEAGTPLPWPLSMRHLKYGACSIVYPRWRIFVRPPRHKRARARTSPTHPHTHRARARVPYAVREHGILQFLATFHRVKGRRNDVLRWGDEVRAGIRVHHILSAATHARALRITPAATSSCTRACQLPDLSCRLSITWCVWMTRRSVRRSRLWRPSW